jgi:hypothetical protein
MPVFPYLRKGSQAFPIVDVTLSGPTQRLTVKALVDSGASLSVFRAEIIDYLGIALNRGTRVYLEGIGGRILGYRHRVQATVGATRFALSVVFSRELTVSFNLLGRDNFFEHFRITFDERRQLIHLEPYRV